MKTVENQAGLSGEEAAGTKRSAASGAAKAKPQASLKEPPPGVALNVKGSRTGARSGRHPRPGGSAVARKQEAPLPPPHVKAAMNWPSIGEGSFVRRAAMDEQSMERRKQFVRLNEEDRQLLLQWAGWAASVAPQIAKEFYDWQFSFPPTLEFFERIASQRQIPLAALRKHLEAAQAGYFAEVFAGAEVNWDLRYFERRLQVGVTHDRIDLPFKWYIGSYAEYRRLLQEHLLREDAGPETVRRVMDAAEKVLNLDMQGVGDAFILSTMHAILSESSDGEQLARSLGADQSDHVGKLKQEIRTRLAKLVDAEGQISAMHRSQAVIEFAMDGTILAANQNFLELMGYGLEEIVGKHHRELVEPEARDSAEYREFWAKLNRGEFHSAEYKRLGKGGREVWIRATYNPVLDRNKKVAKVVKFATNISAEKRALQAMVQDALALGDAAVTGRLYQRVDVSKHHGDYRNVMEAMNLAVDSLVHHLEVSSPAFIVDRDFTIQYVNQQALKVLGQSANTVVGTKCYDQFQTRDCKTERCATGQCMARGEAVSAETQVNPLGKQYDIAYTGTPIKNRSGEVIGAMEVITDLTALKSAARTSDKHADFQAAEVQKLIVSLGKIANGDLDVETRTVEADADTQAVAASFNLINQALARTVAALRLLVADSSELARDAAAGRVSARADASKHEGEYRKIVEGINDTLAAIVEPLKLTAQNASSLASSSEELSAVSQQMAGNAEETATQANVVSAASEQVSRNVSSVASASEQMQASIREIAKNANESARVAKNAVGVATVTNDTVKKLGESSVEIGNVIKVITSIAQQTNLLALNATIEAARAGEAGKGFAVVANEVKELAKQTAKATEEISQKIEAIQGDTKGAVKAIEEIGTIINQINDISNSIASAVEEQTVTTNEISRSVTEAAKGVGDIAKNIGGVATAARSTTQGASDTQKAAQELSQMATSLQAAVSRFRF